MQFIYHNYVFEQKINKKKNFLTSGSKFKHLKIFQKKIIPHKGNNIFSLQILST